MRASERDRFKTAPQHRCDLITEGTRLSVSTIKRRLNEGNLNGRVARKKRLISANALNLMSNMEEEVSWSGAV